MAWDTGSIASAAPWAALSTKLKNLVGGTGVENWSFVENIPAGTGAGQSGSTGYAVDVFRCRGTANLYKRTNQLNLYSNTNTTDGASFTHTVVTPGASKFITIFIANTKASAADDPTGVTLDGSNAPTFTKIKSQAGANVGEIKGTLWIGKSSGSAPTGTILTVTYPATQTSCTVIMDQWDCCDLTLAATSVDPTGAAQIGIQAVGGSGTSETAHSATLAAFLGAQSVAVTWAAQMSASSTYTNKTGWTPLQANITMATPTGCCRGQYRPNQEDLIGVLTLGSNAAESSWCAISFEFQRATEATTVTSPNDAGKDWFFYIEIPVPDGTVTSVMNVSEDYDGFRQVAKIAPLPTTATPISPGGWRDNTLASYTGVIGNQRANLAHQALNTTGFTYWIKLTKNDVFIGTRVGSAETYNAGWLMDSFVTNATDGLPLLCGCGSLAAAPSFTRLPGVTTNISTNCFQVSAKGWTTPVPDGFTTNAAGSQDLWGSQKVHVARVLLTHTAGRAAGAPTTAGYARGVLKADWLCMKTGGAVNGLDTMTISGVTWTVVYKGTVQFGSSGSDQLILLARAN